MVQQALDRYNEIQQKAFKDITAEIDQVITPKKLKTRVIRALYPMGFDRENLEEAANYLCLKLQKYIRYTINKQMKGE